MEKQRHGSRNSYELTSCSTGRRQRKLTQNGIESFESLKPAPSEILPPAKAQMLVLPNSYQPETKYSNIRIFEAILIQTTRGFKILGLELLKGRSIENVVSNFVWKER